MGVLVKPIIQVYLTFVGMNSSPPSVLVAPLNWGLGHATRCIPVIRELIKQNAKVYISAAGGGKNILEKEFPSVSFIDIPGISIKYPKNGAMVRSMVAQMPSIISAIRKENRILKDVVKAHKITHVISDNRYGLFFNNVKTAFITHQVNIKSSSVANFFEPALNLVNRWFINKFDELWIPDLPPPENISGNLSKSASVKIRIQHTGILTRFSTRVLPRTKKYEIIALISGPEPQRSLLEAKLTPYLKLTGKDCLLVQGLPGEDTSSKEKQLEIISSISTTQLEEYLHHETLLISRPGYSTIMDMAALHHKKMLFIPTPGQTEQEYLSKHLFRMYGVRYVHQHGELPEFHSIESSNFGAKLTPEALETTINEFLTI